MAASDNSSFSGVLELKDPQQEKYKDKVIDTNTIKKVKMYNMRDTLQVIADYDATDAFLKEFDGEFDNLNRDDETKKYDARAVQVIKDTLRPNHEVTAYDKTTGKEYKKKVKG